MNVTKVLCDTDQDLVTQASEYIRDKINNAIKEKDRCLLGLSGGSSPVETYKALGRLKDVDWTKVIIFLVDDRYIGADEKTSNQKLVTDSLLAFAPIPSLNIIFPNTSLPLDVCIQDYENELREVIGLGRVDVLILGLGEDGHFASIFPNMKESMFNDVLNENKFACHTTTDTFDVKDRITTTYSVLQNAENSIFLLYGEKKLKVWDEMMNSDNDFKRWPAKNLSPFNDIRVFIKK